MLPSTEFSDWWFPILLYKYVYSSHEPGESHTCIQPTGQAESGFPAGSRSKTSDLGFRV
jgi:hypothetical protein